MRVRRGRRAKFPEFFVRFFFFERGGVEGE